MKRQMISRQYTLVGQLFVLFWLFIFTFAISMAAANHSSVLEISFLVILLTLFGAILLLTCIRIFRIGNVIKARVEKLKAVAETLNAKFYSEIGPSIIGFGEMSLMELGTQRDKDFDNFITTKDWSYCDYSYAVYRHTKSGDYKAYTQYYGIMVTRLPRALPNVFFDSLKASKRQFRFHFTRDQKHSLEGDFDKHFATYFPENYTIDSMSFISPEVMWALKEADDCDIEIIGDKIFLYSPLYEPKEQIAEMSAKILKIKSKLLNNIVTYRDERLPYELGRERVALQGASLKRSKLIARLTLAAVILYLIARIVLETWLRQ